MRLDPWIARKRKIARVQSALVRDHYPRLQMGWIVTLTGFAGLAASFLMLQAGLTAIGERYFFAMCVAYLTFLLLLWGWLRLRGDSFDVPTFDSAPAPARAWSGQGGSFDGGGASADVDLSDFVPATDTPAVGDALGAVDAGDAAIPLAVLLLVVGIVCSSFFVIYSAPVLFSELLVDGVLAASLYRRMRGLDQRHWLESAVRRTFLPFVLTAAVVTAAGWSMGRYAPEARSIGEVLQHRVHAR